MGTIRLTMAQALVRFLQHQLVERDGQVQQFFAGCFGIFGHGNLSGLGQALLENPDFRFYLARNEQAMVHTAVGYARAKNRLGAFACTSSIGPGATNMVTGAALATVNRLPVLLLPGDIFARRNVAPVLQQLESDQSQDVSVNDCFKPVSRYWDRINRPQQLVTALPEAMRVLLSPAQTGCVTLCLPQDVQTEAFDYPESMFEERVWHCQRPRPDEELLLQASEIISQSSRPLFVAGGGVIYSGASAVLSSFSERFGIPVAETQAGKSSLSCQHAMSVGALGSTGTLAANALAREADLVIGVGTRYSDFTTASKTAFQNPAVRFININVCDFDSFKHNALPLVGDARSTLAELEQILCAGGGRASATAPYPGTSRKYREHVEQLRQKWQEEVERLCQANPDETLRMSQAQVIGLVNAFARVNDVVVCAAGSLPGDLHKLWRCYQPQTYHVEYGYSCMGYEIAGGLGVKLAQPERDVYVLVGDGSYLMMSQEIVTAVQEGIKLTILLIDNQGFASIGRLSRALGLKGFGTQYRYRDHQGQLNGDYLPVDLTLNASSLGAAVFKAETASQLQEALLSARATSGVSVITVLTDTSLSVPDYESWWDVPVAEVSASPAVQEARGRYQRFLHQERGYYTPTTARCLASAHLER